VLYDFVGKGEVVRSALLEMFFDLVLICMKADENLNRVLAMCKRMLQLCFSANSNFIVTTLLAIDKVVQSNEGLKIFLQQGENVMEDEPEKKEVYDPNKRDPLFAGAERTCVWELKCLCSHFHPTVRKFANALVAGEPIKY
jgi:ribosome biogenesis protein MAK21